jgi:hypothetical protein
VCLILKGVEDALHACKSNPTCDGLQPLQQQFSKWDLGPQPYSIWEHVGRADLPHQTLRKGPALCALQSPQGESGALSSSGFPGLEEPTL